MLKTSILRLLKFLFAGDDDESKTVKQQINLSVLHYPFGKMTEDTVAILRMSNLSSSKAKEMTFSEGDADRFFEAISACFENKLNVTILTDKSLESIGFIVGDSGDLEGINRVDYLGRT